MVCENVKRIKAVDISPKTDVIEVAGRNAQGKSSLMDCIAFALGGKELIQERPVREGEKRAEVTLDLGEMKVTRSWTANDKSYLRIEADGKEQKSPQGILDRLLGQYTFDPLQFARLCETPEGRREQVKVLIGFCGGFDFAAAEKRKSDLGYYSPVEIPMVPLTDAMRENGISVWAGFRCEPVLVKTNPGAAKDLVTAAAACLSGAMPDPTPACEYCLMEIERTTRAGSPTPAP